MQTKDKRTALKATTIRLSKETIGQLDYLVKALGLSNRTEVIRFLAKTVGSSAGKN